VFLRGGKVMLEIRRHSYRSKASILHIDRREEFKKKLCKKNATEKKNDDKFVIRFEDKI
jgi:hypothetical protein